MTSFWDNFFSLFQTGKYLQFLLFLGGLLILKSFWNLQKNTNNPIDFTDLLLGRDGKASGSKIMQIGAFAISTWAFVYLVIKNNLSEWYYTTYMIAWSGSHLISKWLTDKSIVNERHNQQYPGQHNPNNGQIKPPPGFNSGEDDDRSRD